MPHRIGAAASAAFAALLLIPAAAWACTQEEYLTDEERASGRYDNTPPGYQTAWGSGAPHSHETSATAPAEETEATAPAVETDANPPADETGDRPPAEEPAGARSTPAPTPTSAPEAAAPAPVAPPPAAATPDPVTRPVAPAAGHVAHPVGPAAKARTRKPASARSVAVRPERVTDRTGVGRDATAVTALVARAAPAPDGDRLPVEFVLAGALALLALGGAAAATIRRRRAPDQDLHRSAADAALEAELQELIGEERARAALARDPAHPL